MTFDWQTTVALALVAIAALHVARTAWLSIGQRRAACGGCGTCSAAGPGESRAIISVDQLAETADSHTPRVANGQPPARASAVK